MSQHIKKSLFTVCGIALLAHLPSGATAGALDLMHLCEPADAAWDQPLVQPQIPPPPSGAGLRDAAALRPCPPLAFTNEAALAAEAAKPDGWVKGQGTIESPYIIQNLEIRGFSNQTALAISKSRAPLLIENVRAVGCPVDATTPSEVYGIHLQDCRNVTVRHCEVSRCMGIGAKGAAQEALRFEDCLVFSSVMGIFTDGGSHCTAVGNYVRDSVKYGVILYSGADHVIENNYVAWTGREGIGTNGKSPHHRYRNNVILHTGWTAINVEGSTDDYLVEGNLITDSHYGIIMGGRRSVCRENQIFYSSQVGIWAWGSHEEGMTISSNLVVGSGTVGIELHNGKPAYPPCDNARVIGNRVWQSDIGIRIGAAGDVLENNDITRCYNGITGSNHPALIRNNRIYAGREAIVLAGIKEPGLIIENNRIHHTVKGIVLTEVESANVISNRFDSVGSTVNLTRCEKVRVIDNEACQIPYGGAALRNSRGCTVAGNRFVNGVTEALHVTGGGENAIQSNTVANFRSEQACAGLVMEGAQDCRVTGNEFRRCAVAVAFSRKPGGRDSFGRQSLPGNDSQNVVMTGNRYADNGQDVVFQQGAGNPAASNTLERAATARK